MKYIINILMMQNIKYLVRMFLSKIKNLISCFVRVIRLNRYEGGVEMEGCSLLATELPFLYWKTSFIWQDKAIQGQKELIETARDTYREEQQVRATKLGWLL